MRKNTDMNEITSSDPVRTEDWDDFIGQKRLKRRLDVYIQSAIAEERELEHMLLVATPGAGKSTLARLVAQRLGDPFYEFRMPITEKTLTYFIKDCVGGVLLLDELHAARPSFQELLLTALQEGYIQTPNGVRWSTDRLTFIAATTEPHMIIKPLWDRFAVKPEFDEYSDDDMVEIVKVMARRVGIEVSAELAEHLGRAAGGVPREAGNLVRGAARLLAIGMDPTPEVVLDLVGIDPDGLTDRHMKYLRALDELGGVSGLPNICTMLQLSAPVIQDLERLLIKRKLLRLEPNGRSMQPAAYAKIPSHNNVVASMRRKTA